MEELYIEEIMTRDVATCAPDDPLLDVVREFSLKKFSCMIVTEEKKPVGIVTERDLVDVLVETLQNVEWDNLAIRNFMSSPVITVNADLTLNEVVLLTHMNKIRHIPVVNAAGELVGLLTQSDIIDGCFKND